MHIVVVGAGPAGLMAAIAAARSGGTVTLCEQLDRAGVKLMATGGGHGNLTNTLPEDEFMAWFGRHGQFMRSALRAMSRDQLLEFFDELHVPTVSPDGHKILPKSNSAITVQQALLRACHAAGVTVRVGTRVKALRMEHGHLMGLETSDGFIASTVVVLATGGKGYPAMGSTGAGYEFARQAGHTIVPPLPALVPLITKERWVGHVSGISVSPVRIWINLPRLSKQAYSGALLFTHRGISGPAVLDISGSVAARLVEQPAVPVAIDLRPDMDADCWASTFDTWTREHGKKRVHNLLAPFFAGALSKILCELSGVPEETTASHLSKLQRDALGRCLTALELTITATEGFDCAMVTRGGVSLRDCNPGTLESKVCPGLFVAGELLDLDGPTGGFNLQWAFSSGWLAGLSAAHRSAAP